MITSIRLHWYDHIGMITSVRSLHWYNHYIVTSVQTIQYEEYNCEEQSNGSLDNE